MAEPARPETPAAKRRGEGAAPRPALMQRLGWRLSLLLAVALLPLGVISLVQANAWWAAAREQRSALLLGETLRAITPAAGLIREAQGTAATLAITVPPLIGDDAACDALMTRVKAEGPPYGVAAFVPLSGLMTCGSDGAEFDYSADPLLQEIVADLRPHVYLQPWGPVSGVSVILVVEPVADPDGEGYLGYIGIAVPHAALSPAEGTVGEEGPIPEFVTFDQEGTVLTSSEGPAAELRTLPRSTELRDLSAAGSSTFTDRTAAGQERFYAAIPLIEDELFVLGSVPMREAVSLGPVSIFTPFLLAALMWAGSLVVAWIAAERLVTRYIRRLSRAIGAFASGNRAVGDLDMTGAPAEIREVGQAFTRMTDTILHDEAELENTVHQREVLLREVHHRVKNNLQLIASIMNMQSRRARSPETKALMRGLQDRVMSLATVHKELYQTSGLTDVRADELLGDITRQIVGMASAPGRTFRIETDFAPVLLTPDQAVPLSLLLTEGLTNAIKYAEAEPGEPSPALCLRFGQLAGGRAELTISNSAGPVPPDAPLAEGTGLGRQLVAAFASQLGGEVRAEGKDGRYLMGVEFALAAVRSGEVRGAG